MTAQIAGLSAELSILKAQNAVNSESFTKTSDELTKAKILIEDLQKENQEMKAKVDVRTETIIDITNESPGQDEKKLTESLPGTIVGQIKQKKNLLTSFSKITKISTLSRRI